VIVDYIDAHRDRFGVAPICRVLAEHGTLIAPSTYYAAVHIRGSDADLDDAYRANALLTLWQLNRRVYGAAQAVARRSPRRLGTGA
jgi:hypothetical protein